MTKRNMKIPVENNLDEIVGELERLGYRKSPLFHKECKSMGIYSEYMKFDCYDMDVMNISGCKLTTLAELKEM